MLFRSAKNAINLEAPKAPLRKYFTFISLRPSKAPKVLPSLLELPPLELPILEEPSSRGDEENYDSAINEILKKSPHKLSEGNFETDEDFYNDEEVLHEEKSPYKKVNIASTSSTDLVWNLVDGDLNEEIYKEDQPKKKSSVLFKYFTQDRKSVV